MKETQHLIKWWFIWLGRLLRTTYHIFNRRAYRLWKRRQSWKRGYVRDESQAIYGFAETDIDMLYQEDQH